MGIFDFIKIGTPLTAAKRLIGQWKIFKSEGAVTYDDSSVMEFTKDGKLIYSVREPDKTVIMNLTYRVDHNLIITDQPSSPREEQTEYEFETDDILLLKYKNSKAWFQRENK